MINVSCCLLTKANVKPESSCPIANETTQKIANIQPHNRNHFIFEPHDARDVYYHVQFVKLYVTCC